MSIQWRLYGLMPLIGLLAGCAASDEARPLTIIASSDPVQRYLREQIEPNWHPAVVVAHPELAGDIMELRIALRPDETVTRVQVVNERPNDPAFQELSQSFVRAVWMTHRFELPSGKTYSTILMQFGPSTVGS